MCRSYIFLLDGAAISIKARGTERQIKYTQATSSVPWSCMEIKTLQKSLVITLANVGQCEK